MEKRSILTKIMNNLPFKTRTIKSELMGAFITVIFFTSTIIGLYYFSTMNTFVKEKVATYNSEIIKQVGEKLDFLLENVEISKRQLIGLSTNQDIFNVDDSASSIISAEFVKNVEESLKNVRRSYPGIADIFMIGYNGNVYTSNNYFIKERLINKDWIKSFMTSDMDDVAISTHLADYEVVRGTGRTVVSFLKKVTDIRDATTEIGIIQIDLDYGQLKNIIESISTDEESLFYIIDSNDRIIYFPDAMYLGNDVDRVEYNGRNMGATAKYENRNADDIIVKYTLQNTQWKVIGVIPLDSISKKFNNVIIISGYLGLVTVVLSLVVAFYFSKRITRPIQALIRTMKKVGEGNFKKAVTNTNNADLQALSYSFNTMVDKVDSLMTKVIKKESESANARFIALQAQINPHFLYNTLETIRSIALRNGVASISNISKAMATIFRYSIDDKSYVVTLKEELEHVKNFIRIQKYRYGNKFDVEYNIDEKLLDCEIIKLVLQPLVENAIYHGIELKKKKSTIVISCQESERGIDITIYDDGLGIPAKVLEDLNNKMSQYEIVSTEKRKMDFGIGIVNVNARLKLYYGNEYGLYIESEINKGTGAIVRIPARRKPSSDNGE